jgi:hypothetical protein
MNPKRREGNVTLCMEMINQDKRDQENGKD